MYSTRNLPCHISSLLNLPVPQTALSIKGVQLHVQLAACDLAVEIDEHTAGAGNFLILRTLELPQRRE